MDILVFFLFDCSTTMKHCCTSSQFYFGSETWNRIMEIKPKSHSHLVFSAYPIHNIFSDVEYVHAHCTRYLAAHFIVFVDLRFGLFACICEYVYGCINTYQHIHPSIHPTNNDFVYVYFCIVDLPNKFHHRIRIQRARHNGIVCVRDTMICTVFMIRMFYCSI